MPTPKKGPRLGGSPTHQKHILSNLAKQLIEFGEITTTETKAKTLQPYFEKLVTRARRGDIHSRRLVQKKLHDKDYVYMLFDEVVPEIDADRQGGYTRITRIGTRKGDNAPMAVIEIVTEPVAKKAVVREATKTAEAAAEVVDEIIEEVVEEEILEEAEEIVEAAEEAEAVVEAEEIVEEAEAAESDK